jgi:hypothetical protein
MVLVLSTLPLIGIEAMSTRQQTPQSSYDSAVEALTACQAWRQQEGVFTALTPPCIALHPSHAGFKLAYAVVKPTSNRP